MPTSETDDSGAAAAQGIVEGVKPLRNRVRVIAEVVNDPDEIAMASAAFRQRGWFCRPPRDGEVLGYPEPHRGWLVIEVRFPGFPRSAAKAASKRVDQVIAKFRLGVWVRSAVVIDYPWRPANIYYVEDAVPSWVPANRTLAPLLRLVGVPKTTGLIRVAGNVEGLDVHAEQTRLQSGRPIDPSRQAIRAAVPGSMAGGKTVAIRLSPMPVRIGGALGLVVALLCGVIASWIPDAWKALPLLVGIAQALPLIAGFPRNQPLWLRGAVAVPLVSAVLVGGLASAGSTPHHAPGVLLAVSAAIAIAAFTGYGLALTLRESPLTAQISWVIPFAVTIFTPLALWLGGNFDAEYLTTQFGIPADAVSVPTLDKLAIATKSMGVGLALVLFFVGLIGWARYFHWFDEGMRLIPVLAISISSVVYLLTAILLGLSIVLDAANAAANAAAAGRQPADYFGIQATLACVYPVMAASAIPQEGGPLPADRLVLSFGADGDWLWLWDPRTRQPISVPQAAVSVFPAVGDPAHCTSKAP